MIDFYSALLIVQQTLGIFKGQGPLLDHPAPAPSEVAPYAKFDYCLPTQSCWPSEAEWDEFNKKIDGTLVTVVPWSEPCYDGPGFNQAECDKVKAGYKDGFARSAQFGTAQILNWEFCGEESCVLADANSGKCKRGRLPTYGVAATTKKQVETTVKWAFEKRIHLSIRNTGHEYHGRSTSPVSLALYTNAFKWMNIVEKGEFKPTGSDKAHSNAVIRLGVGVQARDVYQFTNKNGKAITLGACPSVGVAGGYIQGGGHGPLAPKYGSATDNAVQFTILTVDGEILDVNEFQHTDLFWALRGGGGGTWGVVLETIMNVYDDAPMEAYRLQVKRSEYADATYDEVLADFLQALARITPVFEANAASFYSFVQAGSKDIDSFYALAVLFRTTDKAHVEAVMKPLTDHIKGSTFYQPIGETPVVSSHNTFLDMYMAVMAPGADKYQAVGGGQIISTRLIPKQYFKNKQSFAELAKSVVDGKNILNQPTIPIQVFGTGPLTQPDNSKTGLNPAFRDQAWQVVFTTEHPGSATLDERTKYLDLTHKAAEPIRKITPGSGAYIYESDVLEPDWQQAFFGSNYDQLLKVKQKYDPKNYWNVYKGVGWNGLEDPLYKCYKQA